MNLDLQFYRDLHNKLGEALEQHAAELVNGRASDFADYRHRVGRIKGLQEALHFAKEVNDEMLGIKKERKE